MIVAPTLHLPVELEKEVSVIDVPLPAPRGPDAAAEGHRPGGDAQPSRAIVELNREQAESLVAAAHGLTLAEAENAFAKAIADDNRLDGSDVRLLLEEKSQVIRKSGMLEYFASRLLARRRGRARSTSRRWLARRQNAFSEAARAFGLPGAQGPLAARACRAAARASPRKAIATSWRLPLVRLDMGRIYSGLVGSSEENLRRAIRVAESLAPVVLWVDEIEKGLAGIARRPATPACRRASSAPCSPGCRRRAPPVFVVATANRIDMLPPELLRKGRFDEIFFVDLPTASEREAIFEIQLRRRGRDPKTFPVAALAKLADGFSRRGDRAGGGGGPLRRLRRPETARPGPDRLRDQGNQAPGGDDGRGGQPSARMGCPAHPARLVTKSRFDNLELERKHAGAEPRKDLERFAREAQRPAAPQEGGEVAAAPDQLPKLHASTERFAASGDDGVALQLADDETQPFKRCPTCRRDSTRYETACRFCRAPLDTPEAIAFNEELWKRMRAEAAAERTASESVRKEQQSISHEQYQRLLENQQNLAQDLKRHYSGGPPDGLPISPAKRLGLIGAGIGLLYLAKWIPTLGLTLACAAGGVLCLAFAVPTSWWWVLGRPRGRGPWL